eukprot:TRINITY_DN35201_c0_g1_i1.p1 TRINITY_DN35201_c0_g1~~TRINITY_DN35201_c0_g1_i1.p1  ORF type:complete len:411 (+),score=39.99 TRINITY_DN35201_c0_g1_i1:152-1384(+)
MASASRSACLTARGWACRGGWEGSRSDNGFRIVGRGFRAHTAHQDIAGRSNATRSMSARGGLAALDAQTVQLHQKYHDRTIEYTMKHMEWVESKAFGTDADLSPEQSVAVETSARNRLQRWPRLESQDTHKVCFGSSRQRFSTSTTASETVAREVGDPCDHVFVINLPRRPTKLRHSLFQLRKERLNATIVDGLDGDAVLCKEDMSLQGVKPLPGYTGHGNHDIPLTTGEVGCFMSHFTVWHHMVERGIESALILEDDFEMQEDFALRLGQCLEACRREDWNLLYIGRSPVEPDVRRLSDLIVEPGYSLWTVGYVIRLDAARALLEAGVESCMAPLDDFFSVAMGRYSLMYNEFALEWGYRIPCIFRPLATTPPLVMPYVGSMFLSDTAMLRKGTRLVKDLPSSMFREAE